MLSSTSTDGALHGRLIRSPLVAQARRSRTDEQCRMERMHRASSPAHARRTPASEPDMLLLHKRVHANHGTRTLAHALIALRPSEQVVIITCHHSVQSVAVMLMRQRSEHDCCCQFDVTEFNVTESH